MAEIHELHPNQPEAADEIAHWNKEMESALQAAVSPVTDVIAKMDAAIEYHEEWLSQLREARRRAKRVESALAPPETKPRKSSPKLAEITSARHREERIAKAERVAEFARAHPGEDITAATVYDALSQQDAPKVSRGLVYDLLREAHEDGLLRLDRQGSGGQSIYRLVGS